MKVSIIVPVYNTEEQKLRRCLNSIITQDFEDFECIIIDDGSTSAIGRVCDEYAANDSRLKVIHQNNGGVSSARNAGLSVAKGEWIVCIDSDDFVLPCHLSSLLEIADEKTDMALTSFRLLFPDKVTEHHYSDRVYIGKNEVRTFICHTDFLNYQIPWDKMYRRSIIRQNGIWFDERLTLSEDRLFCYETLIYITKIVTSSQLTYIHDGTDLSTLSYRFPERTMQEHLYQKISKATSAIINTFEIEGDESLPIWKSNWQIFETLIKSSYSIKGNIFKAIRLQKRYLNKVFDWSLFGKINNSTEISQYMQSTSRQQILKGHFLKYDLSILLRFIKSKFCRK